MDEKSLPDLLSQLLPGETEEPAVTEEESVEEQNDALVEGLKAAAGQPGGAFETAVEEFLSGKGVLHQTAVESQTRSGGSAADEVAHVLISQFKLSPTVATVVAMLLVKVAPSIGKKPKKAASSKKKARSETKPKPKTKAKAKTKPKAKVEKASEKKAKKKTTTKPKSAVSKSATKKKTSTKTGKK